MILHRNLVEAVANCLNDIFTQNRYADRAIETTLKSNAKWGARDRGFIAESVYEIVRYRLFYENILKSLHEFSDM